MLVLFFSCLRAHGVVVLTISLLDDIVSKAWLQQASGNPLGSWTCTKGSSAAVSKDVALDSTTMPPAAYALLCGLNSNKYVYIDVRQCVLGQLTSGDNCHSLQCSSDREQGTACHVPSLLSRLRARCGKQTLFNTAGLVGYTTLSGSDDGANNATCPLIHLSEDASVAREHAIVQWNAMSGAFEVKAISFAGIFVNGIKKVSTDPPVVLKQKDALQIGCEIFMFLLPQDHFDEVSSPQADNLIDSLQLRKELLDCWRATTQR
jgi:hypothetical protein